MQGMYTDKSKQPKYPKQNRTLQPLIVHIVVYKYKNKQDDIPLSPFYYSTNILTILQFIFTDYTCNSHVSHGWMKHNADNLKVCHTKQKSIESHANNWK